MKHSKYCFLLICALAPLQLLSQVLPKDGSKLNYRLIGFSFPRAEKAISYALEIADGDMKTDEDFDKHKISAVSCRNDSVIAEVPGFGRQYTWRVQCTLASKKITKSELHHFSTTSIPEVDTGMARLRIINPPVKYTDDYVFVDGDKALYDMKGNAVWHLPEIDGVINKRANLRDLKLSPFGTITLMLDERAYEINYQGDILWKAPNTGEVSGQQTEHYHHELTRLANGHYMILGMEAVPWTNKYVLYNDSVMRSGAKPGTRREASPPKTTFGTVIEYDEHGRVVWYWKSSKYFIGSDLEHYNPAYKMLSVDVHENSFYFDEENKVIYVGFKNIGRIVKVKYPEGNVIAAYGEVYKEGVPVKGNGLFCDQHNCRLSQKGYLYLYNNNACNEGSMPAVVMMEQPAGTKTGLKKVWEYVCNGDEVHVTSEVARITERQKEAQQRMGNQPMEQLFKMHTTSGGSVQEMPDQSLFVCMNTEYCKLFIAGKDKQILWNAIPERYSKTDQNWVITDKQYRASIIDKKALEQLVWQAMSAR